MATCWDSILWYILIPQFGGMNIHLPAFLVWAEGYHGFDLYAHV